MLCPVTATPIWTNTWLGVFPGRVSRGHKPKHDGEKLRLFLPYHSSKVRVAVKGRHRRCFDAAVKKAKHNGDYKDKPSAVLDPVKAALDGMMRRKMMSAWSSVNFVRMVLQAFAFSGTAALGFQVGLAGWPVVTRGGPWATQPVMARLPIARVCQWLQCADWVQLPVCRLGCCWGSCLRQTSRRWPFLSDAWRCSWRFGRVVDRSGVGWEFALSPAACSQVSASEMWLSNFFGCLVFVRCNWDGGREFGRLSAAFVLSSLQRLWIIQWTCCCSAARGGIRVVNSYHDIH